MENTELIQQRRAQRQQAQQKKRRQKNIRLLLILVGLPVLLAALCLGLVTCGGTEDPDPGQAQQDPAQADLPEEPAITWMTLPDDRQLTAQQYFVYDCQAQRFVTIAGEQTEKIYPASVTKLFTAYVAMQYLQAGEVLTAGSELELVAYGSSVAELEQGDRLTVAQLVEAMLLPSGNDAAYVLAAAAGRRISGAYSQDAASAVSAFVERMNEQAQRVGMTGTHFANPDGIHSDDHYTTYADLAVLGTLALKNPYITRYAATASQTLTLGTDRTVTWKNTNALIDPASPYYCPLATGLKTGQTPYAGSCLLSAFQTEDRTLLIGVFGCPEEEDRFADTLQLFNQNFQ